MSIRYMILGALVVAGFSLSPATIMAQDETAEATTSAETIGYFLGVSVGQQMSAQGFKSGDFDFEALVAGLTDGLAKKDPELSEEELKNAQESINTLLTERQQELMASKAEAAKAWAKENAKKEGVKSLASGVQYSVIKSGKGGSPSAADTVKVHYTGKLINGDVFDSSVERGQPASFQVGQVIKGWQQALQKMKVGDKWMLYIPPELAYGERGSRGAIGPNELLIFEVELLEIL